MALSIRHATPEDNEALLELLMEVEDFYGESEPPEVLSTNLKEAVFTDKPSAHVLIAYNGSDPVGFAAYSFLWPATGSTRSLYLKELYVRARNRRSGVGRSLMQELSKMAYEAQCTRIEWTTDQTNGVASQFYSRLGHQPSTTKAFYRAELDHAKPAIHAP